MGTLGGNVLPGYGNYLNFLTNIRFNGTLLFTPKLWTF